ncbi:enterobactin exporter EntS [uncultured Clostridium sp.]|uniref:MFS transporter n=1 Tax=uncultured Clostridium sp. TaxID=59620 RepID=UPI000823059B|nr:MFS transporter [uncultured Clostridium sp.]SCJ93464.1 enterobactin exporter EntS [uncultured Clostridium sp.]
MKNKSKLWDRNFTIITIGTIISAIGSIGLNFALSIVVYNNTSSIMLTGVYNAVIIIPQVLFPVLVAPYIDRISRKKIIVFLDYLLGAIYTIFGMYLVSADFNYYLFIVVGFIASTIGVIYSLAYNALFPDLIPDGFAQKGYSVSVLIYPIIAASFTPIAAIVYESVGIEILFIIEGILLLICASVELLIKYEEGTRKNEKYNLQEYFADIKEGVLYLKKEKGILYIYLYMAVTIFASQGVSLLLVPFFQSHMVYNTTHYSLLLSAETIGRTVGGALHYMIKIPIEKRYEIASKVYIIYDVLDGILMFVAFPIMIIMRFVEGFLGVNSANIRESSVQSYIQKEKRARVNSFFQLLVFGGMFLANLVAGVLGEIFSLPIAGAVFGCCGVVGALMLICKNKTEISKIYNRDI